MFEDDTLLTQRRRLMEGNQREVEHIIQTLERRCDELESQRNAEVRSLELLLEATKEKLRISTRKLRASEAAMSDLQRETDLRTNRLEDTLDATRRELSAMQDSMRSLVHAHRKIKVEVDSNVTQEGEHKKRLRSLELREIELVDQLTDASVKIQRFGEESARQKDKYAEMERLYLQSQRDLAVSNGQLDDARAAKHCHEEVRRSGESVRLLQDSLHRILHVVAQFGCSKDDSHEHLLRARDVFKYVVAVGGRQFSFLGDAALVTFANNGRSLEALALQDIKAAIHNHNFALHAFPRTTAPPAHIDPFLRLETEREFWLPKQVIEVAAKYRDSFLRDTPVDVVYSLVVSVATAIRDYSSSVLTPGEVALLDLERKERASAQAKSAKRAVEAQTRRLRSPERPAPPPKHDPSCNAAQVALDLAPEVVRGITGLRCLMSQIDQLCTSSGMFKALPAAHVRDIISSCLRTFERLARGTTPLTKSAITSGAADPAGYLYDLERGMESSMLILLESCNTIRDDLHAVYKAVRSALKAPQDPTDPEIHKRDCCASRGSILLTKQFKCFILSECSSAQKKAVDDIETLQRELLRLREVLYDSKIDHLKRPTR